MREFAASRAGRCAAERQPDTFDQVRARFAFALLPRGQQQRRRAQQPLDAIGRESGNAAQQRRQDRAVARGFADRREIGQREPDERRAQHREPCDAVERRVERARQRFEIAHHGDIRERFELHADERHRAPPAHSRIARRCGRAPASTAMDSLGLRAFQFRDQIRGVLGLRLRAAIALDAIDARLAARDSCARRRSPGAARRCLRTSSGRGNTRANTSLHQCTSAGAERKLRRSSSGVERASSRARRRAPSRSGRPPHCGNRRWIASDRRPGTACAHRRSTSPA